ncbi:MAG: hypothetical protein ACK55Z_22995, partial [bacterium]
MKGIAFSPARERRPPCSGANVRIFRPREAEEARRETRKSRSSHVRGIRVLTAVKLREGSAAEVSGAGGQVVVYGEQHLRMRGRQQAVGAASEGRSGMR